MDKSQLDRVLFSMLRGELCMGVYVSSMDMFVYVPESSTSIIYNRLRSRMDHTAFHSIKKPVTTVLTYPWKCTVLHCNHLGNTWKPLVLMTRHFNYCPSACEVISTSGF